MRTINTAKTALLILAMTAGAARAHPDHGAEPGSHWLTQPDHLAVVVLGAVVAGFALRRLALWLRDRADA